MTLMKTAQQTILRATMVAVLYSLFLLAAERGRSQSGPPPFPPVPFYALAAYPLDTPPWNDWYGDPAKGFTNLNIVGIFG
jgi:hypothetical protein